MALNQYGERLPIGARHAKMLENDILLQAPVSVNPCRYAHG